MRPTRESSCIITDHSHVVNEHVDSIDRVQNNVVSMVMNVRIQKRRWISQPDYRLSAPQEGLCPMETVFCKLCSSFRLRDHVSQI